MSKIKIIVVDDHSLFRLGVCSAVNAHEEFEVIAEAGSGEELLRILRSEQLPDIILLDIIMPGLSGLDVAKEIKNQFSEIKIIMLSSENSEKVIDEALGLGVEGFLSKNDATSELKKAILSVYQKEPYYGNTISGIMYEVLIAKRMLGKSRNENTNFSKRELEVVSACAKGLTAKETAESLYISKRTVDWHRSNIFKKLGINSNIDLVKYALKNGIVEL